jgi:hypothetical protein
MYRPICREFPPMETNFAPSVVRIHQRPVKYARAEPISRSNCASFIDQLLALSQLFFLLHTCDHDHHDDDDVNQLNRNISPSFD